MSLCVLAALSAPRFMCYFMDPLGEAIFLSLSPNGEEIPPIRHRDKENFDYTTSSRVLKNSKILVKCLKHNFYEKKSPTETDYRKEFGKKGCG